MNTRTVDAQLLPAGPYPLDGKGFVGTGFTYETIDDLLTNAPESILYDGMMIVDSNNSVTWQLHYDGSAWKKRIYDGMIHVKAAYNGDLIEINPSTVDGLSVVDGDVIFQVGGTPQLRGLWIKDSVGSPDQGTYGGGYKRHSLFKTVEDELANVIIVVDGGDIWKNSQWIYSVMGEITGCAEDENGDAASPELLHWYLYAVRDNDDMGYGNPDYSHLVSTGITDTRLYFDCISTHAFSGQIHSANPVAILDWVFHNYVDATAYGMNVSTNYSSATSVITPYINKPYFIQKIDSTSNFVSVSDDTSKLLPDAILIEKNDWCEIIYHKTQYFSTITPYTHASRKTTKLISGTLTADGDTGLDIPAGYSVFAVYGVTDSATEDQFNIGITPGGVELLSAGGFSSVGAVANTFEAIAASRTLDRSIYLSVVGGWPGANATEIDLQVLVYEDSAFRVPHVHVLNAATYDATEDDEIINVTYSTTGTTAIQLLYVRLSAKQNLIIKDAGGGAATYNITISTEGAATIDGSATYVMKSAYEAIEIYSDGSNYFIK